MQAPIAHILQVHLVILVGGYIEKVQWSFVAMHTVLKSKKLLQQLLFGYLGELFWGVGSALRALPMLIFLKLGSWHDVFFLLTRIEMDRSGPGCLNTD